MRHESPVGWEILDWETVRPGVKKRKVVQDWMPNATQQYRVRQFKCPFIFHEQIVFTLQGQAEITVDSTVVNVSSGSFF